jgi:GxxExxY protein
MESSFSTSTQRAQGAQRFRREYLDHTSRIVIEAAIDVHRTLGPGLLESVYQTCTAYYLREANQKVLTEVALPVHYREVKLDPGFRVDLLVNDCVIVELKSLEHVLPIHRAQLLSYLRLSGLRLGLLINFNVPRLVMGVKRIVNDY